jgi:SNF2 family DNA or RNA helicase
MRSIPLQPIDYQFGTVPFEHQKKVFFSSREREHFALLMEQGTGKSKIIIDTAAWLYGRGEIDGVLVVAPNGVHRNWTMREIPAHLPEEIPHLLFTWAATEIRSKKAQRELFNILSENSRLTFLAMNVESFSTPTGFELAKKYLNTGRRLFVVDESSRIKTPKAIRTKNILRLRRLAPYRRILTGTPVTNSPLDLYTQFRFLDPEILGFNNFYAFKHYYAVWHKEQTSSGQEYERLLDYVNLEELKSLVAPHSFRVTKKECLDLPDKIYESVLIKLSPEQTKFYIQMANDFIIEFGQTQIAAPLVLTRLLRLQQIVGGFLPAGEGDMDDWNVKSAPIPGINPKLEALKDVIEDFPGKIIIWARFRAEIEMIVNFLRNEFGSNSVVQYHGGVPGKIRHISVDSFQDENSPVRFFVGQPRSGGMGLTLTATSTVVYYSNEFSPEARWQSEDRAHRIGQKKSIVYIDLEAIGTIDEMVIDSLKRKKDLADYMTNDKIGELLWGRSSLSRK